MSILNAIKEAQHADNNLEQLAKLPQALIMSMAQRGEIKQDMLMPILGKKAELAEQAAKMKAAEQLAAQGGAQPTVMDNLMSRIAAAENPTPMPQEVTDAGIASQPVPPMRLAGGGIIAFEDGGDVELSSDEDDYQEALDDAHEEAMNSKLYEMISGLKGSASGIGIASGHHGAERGMDGDLESRLRAQIMAKESGGRRYGKNGELLTSSKGALGEMQVMPGTARDPGFGIKPAQSSNPDELRRVGDEYASVLLNRYRDPKLAMIAYNMGPGATDKWLASGADLRKLPKETQNYIQGVRLAQGGEVKHYAGENESLVESEEPTSVFDRLFNQSTLLKDYQDKLAKQREFEKITREQPGFFEKTTKAQREEAANKLAAANLARSGIKTTQPVAKDERSFNEVVARNTAPAPAPVIPQSPEGIKNLQTKADEENFNLMQYIKDREAKMEKAAEQDKWQAALAAGLGMLGGTSQYAWENIGKGGQMGVQQLASSQKGRMAQEAALGKLYGSAAQTDLMNRLRRDQLAQGKELKEDQLAQNLLTAKNSFIEKRLKAKGMDEMMLGTLRRQKAMGKLDPAKEAELNYYERQMQEIEDDANRRFTSPNVGGFSARRIG